MTGRRAYGAGSPARPLDGRPDGRRRTEAVLAVVVGLLAVIAALVLRLNASSDVHASRPVPTADRGTVPGVTASAPPTHASHHAAAKVVPVPRGSRLTYSRFGITAPVTTVHAVNGVMQVPLDPHTVGWWSGGAAPGASAGSAVFVGHVNYAGTSGALSVLPGAHPGDRVGIDEPGLGRHRYVVQAVRTYAKTSGIPQDVFTRSGAPRLVLITCGGPFDASTGNYEDNIVVYAVPA